MAMIAREQHDLPSAREQLLDVSDNEQVSLRWRHSATSLLENIASQENLSVYQLEQRKLLLLEREHENLTQQVNDNRLELQRKDELIRRLETQTASRKSPMNWLRVSLSLRSGFTIP